VPKFVRFSVAEWLESHSSIMESLARRFEAASELIVRSSAINEDGELYAQAGAFLSVPGVKAGDPVALREAVEAVIASYTEGSDSGDNPDDQVIVQEMVQDVCMSGVLFTQDLSSGAPYYVINYDDESGSTDSVTSGTGYSNRTIYIYRESWQDVESPRFLRLLEAVREIERLTDDGCLDIEFAMDSELNVYILQVRRITTQPNWNRGIGVRIADSLNRLSANVGPRLVGGQDDTRTGATVLGKMPDWNPAEMIGNAPRHLAFSLYRFMITDFAWRTARASMGYYEPRGLPLMWSCAGQPFIDVRQSFRSYLPAGIDQSLAERVVDHWVRELAANPELHDKVEFGIAITTWSFDFHERAQRLLPRDLNDAEFAAIHEGFKELTIDLVEGRVASIAQQNAAIEHLQTRRSEVVGSGAVIPDVSLVAQLLEDGIEFGTVPFSVLARHGFIAKTLLDSLVAEGVLSKDDVEAFSQNVPTVATEFLIDIERYGSGVLTETQLFQKYGHLRPGTYDILSCRYDQRDVGFLGSGGESERQRRSAPPAFELSAAQRQAIESRLVEAGFSIGAEQLLEYCAEAIKGREWAKFVFTRSISDSLEVIGAWGQKLGLSREELSHIDIRDILDCRVEMKGRSLEEHLRALSEEGEREHQVTAAIRLPYVLSRPSDFVVIPMLLDQPNFVTLSSVRGQCVLVTGRDVDPETLDGKIVAIESADPGFDWIFTRKIRGLITKFGGANSHMAIRCAEFDLPAAIGCGEQIFERVVRSEYIELDCEVGRIEPVQH
jgi:glutamine kinase